MLIYKDYILVALSLFLALACGEEEVQEEKCGCEQGEVVYSFENREGYIIADYLDEPSWDFLSIKHGRNPTNPDDTGLYTPCNMRSFVLNLLEQDSLKVLVSGYKVRECVGKFPAMPLVIEDISVIE